MMSRHTRPMIVTARWLALLAPLGWGIAAPAVAATAQLAPVLPANVPLPLRMRVEPLLLPDVGLTAQVPESFTVLTTQLAQMMAAQIAPADGSWVINISTPRTTDELASVTRKIDALVAELQGTVTNRDLKNRTSQSAVMIMEPVGYTKAAAGAPDRPGNFRTPGIAGSGERVIAMIPSLVENLSIVKVLTLFQPQRDRFVLFELTCTDKQVAAARPVFDMVVASSVIADAEKTAAGRRDAVSAGKQLTSRFTGESLLAALPDGERIYRLYRPAASGEQADAEELGFRTIKAWKGRLGELRAATSVSGQAAENSALPTRAGDAQEGLLLTVKARLFDRPVPGSARYRLVDTVAGYFLTLDRAEEVWTVRTAVREAPELAAQTGAPNANQGQPAKSARPAAARTLTEVGARSGDSVSISVSESGKSPRAILPTIAGDGYLSQLEMFLIPRLLIKAEFEVETGFYTYRSDSESIALRRDSAERSDAGAWVVRTRIREGDEPQVGTYRDDGELVRTVLPGGVISESTTIAQLVSLYKAKGLPLSAQ